jgi:hypothetical protein
MRMLHCAARLLALQLLTRGAGPPCMYKQGGLLCTQRIMQVIRHIVMDPTVKPAPLLAACAACTAHLQPVYARLCRMKIGKARLATGCIIAP